ncbi:TrbC/VirB2 family protein [Roseibium sediminicola]|uniref:TrbC/VirB2 family protein n=1 Tax=Roseibium sediminicola TaxID=2933272 RepID=A0ABT0H3F0_9HYPH|nr:TrbC/VirB2 family protein [Roseibium sp. CAU 1639]MCK7616208.1 TrbC/VirB2 family protein [Roseibium sp. CAU 1639]
MGILNNFGRLAVLSAFTALVLTNPAMAQDLSPVTTFFTTIGTALTGTLGRAIGLVALCAIGFLFMTGRMNWMFAGSVVLGLVILFGSATILAGF